MNMLVALAAFSIGSILALNYPIGQFIAPVCFLVCALLAFYSLSIFLIIIPAVLPIIGFAPWTGWLSFEELDLLVLATAAGAYARCALEGKQLSSKRTSLLLLVLATLMSASILISMFRGFADAGGFVFGWFQGYNGPMNSIRIGKSFFLALLLIPPMARLQDNPANNIGQKLALGISIGLGTASLAALWERLAFTDLLNFSSDYRSTALFWEMHVGGAALDGWLLITFPFAIWLLRNSRGNTQYAISLCLLGVALYASLTTFSRGVYLALMFSLPLLAWQIRGHLKHVESQQEMPTWGFFRWTVALFLLGTMAGLVFPAGGYRGLIALLGLVSVSIFIPSVLRGGAFTLLLTGSIAGLLSGALLIAIANFLPKGPYVLYALLLAASFSSIHWQIKCKVRTGTFVCTASFFALLLAAGNIADHWGGIEAFKGMGIALAMLLAISLWGMFSKQALWPNELRWQCRLVTAAIGAAGNCAVIGGGR